MTIKVGDKLPVVKFKILGSEGPEDIESSAIFDGKLVVFFALPGAFTPTCHLNHLPGYIENSEVLRKMGVDEIVVSSVNDVWVMDSWSKASKSNDKVRFLADGSADFAKAVGLDIDLGMAGMGIRSKRYSMIVRDGVVLTLNVEDVPGQVKSSGAATILEQLITF